MSGAESVNKSLVLIWRPVFLISPKPVATITIETGLKIFRVGNCGIDLVQVIIQHFNKCRIIFHFIGRPHVIGVIINGYV